MDVDTRLLRSFLAVADSGTLTRAAERLYVSQPALTKQIRQLENQLGVRLFTRSRSGMALTDSGRALAARAPEILDAWDRASRETRRAADRTARILRVGFLASAANEATPHVIAAFTREHPDWRVEMRQATWSNPSAGLAAGDVDVALLRMPFPGQEAYGTAVLLTEPRWVILPAGHRLADHEVVPFRELWGEPFVTAAAETGAWRDYWLGLAERDDPRPVRIGAVTDQPDEWLSAIASGYGVALAPASAARFYARPGLVYRPVSGISPSHLAIAWSRTAESDPVVRDFIRCCRAAAARQWPQPPPRTQ